MNRSPLIALVLALNAFPCIGQAPQSFKYQSVARNSSGDAIANSGIGLRIGIHDGSATGAIVYQETHTVTTNAFGLFNISVGLGTAVVSDFSAIDWGDGAKFIEVEADFSGGTTYISMGTSQLLSVPYALYSSNGPPGPTGDTGPEGPQGPDGADGLNVLNGTADPDGSTGVDGEFYINTSNNTLFGPKTTGDWGGGVSLQGPVGSTGADGLNLLNGTSDPSNGTGLDGEFYINTSTNMLFGPKEGGNWPAGVSLIGPQGPAGDAGVSGILNYEQHLWSTQTIVSSTDGWKTIPESSVNITTNGGPLMITTNMFLSGSSVAATCQPIIDDQWAGSYGGLNDPSPDGIFWKEGLVNLNGGWTSWSTTRIYPGISAGNHTLAFQCAVNVNNMSVCATTVGCGISYVELGE